MILAKVSPVTHSVGNCVKRVVVIISSVLFFRTPVTPINSLGTVSLPVPPFVFLPFDAFSRLQCDGNVFVPAGTGIALAGVFLYSRVKKIKPKTA